MCIRLWNAEDGALLQCMEGQGGPVACLAAYPSADGSYRLAAGTFMWGSVMIWDAATGRLLHKVGMDTKRCVMVMMMNVVVAVVDSDDTTVHCSMMLGLASDTRGCDCQMGSGTGYFTSLRVVENEDEGRYRLVATDPDKGLIIWDLGEAPAREVGIRAANKTG
jgi:WD40 repeat protein